MTILKNKKIDILIDGFTAMERRKQQIVVAVILTLMLLFFVVFSFSLVEKQSAAYYCGKYCTAIEQQFNSYRLGTCRCTIAYPQALITLVSGVEK